MLAFSQRLKAVGYVSSSGTINVFYLQPFVPSVHLDRRDQLSTILRFAFASSNVFVWVTWPFFFIFPFSSWTSVRIPHATVGLCGFSNFSHFCLQDLHKAHLLNRLQAFHFNRVETRVAKVYSMQKDARNGSLEAPWYVFILFWKFFSLTIGNQLNPDSDKVKLCGRCQTTSLEEGCSY